MLIRIFKTFVIVGIVGLAIFLSGCTGINQAQKLKDEGKNREALEMAKEYLHADDPKVRIKAIDLIGSINSNQSGKLITPSLDDADLSVRDAAIKNIAYLRYEPATDKLMLMINSANEKTFELLGTAFRKIGNVATDKLIKSFDSTTDKNKRAILVKMFKSIGSGITDLMIKSLEGKSAFENRDKFSILVALRSPKVAIIMVKYIGDESLGKLIVEGMVKLGHMSALPTIKELQKAMRENTKLETKIRLITVLGRIKDKRSVAILEKMTKDKNNQVRSMADDALLKVRGF
jgi:HEAT repeat protein